MVVDINITTVLPIARDVLWRARSSAPFMSFLVQDGALNRMDASEENKDSDASSASARSRVQTYVPKTVEIPAVVKSFFDDTYLEVQDTQRWDDVKSPYEQSFSISPGVLAEYVRMNGVLRLEPSPDDPTACVQSITGTCAVDIPLVGYYVETAIVEQMGTFYDSYPTHIANFVNVVVSQFADGNPKSLPIAFDRMLAECTESNKMLKASAVPQQNGDPKFEPLPTKMETATNKAI